MAKTKEQLNEYPTRVLITYCCMGCGNEIRPVTALHGKGRCYSCSNGSRAKHGNYAKKVNCCIDCGKVISKYPAQRCWFCASKKGKESHNYKDGRTIGDRFCIDCHKLLSKRNYMVNRCRPCGLSYQHRIGTRDVSGPNNPGWKSGIGRYGHPYYFNTKLKLKIRSRDHFTCQNCGILERDHYRGIIKSALTVHHVNYNKMDCSETNLITLCIACNSKANFNRDYWYDLYSHILEGMYGNSIDCCSDLSKN